MTVFLSILFSYIAGEEEAEVEMIPKALGWRLVSLCLSGSLLECGGTDEFDENGH